MMVTGLKDEIIGRNISCYLGLKEKLPCSSCGLRGSIEVSIGVFVKAHVSIFCPTPQLGPTFLQLRKITIKSLCPTKTTRFWILAIGAYPKTTLYYIIYSCISCTKAIVIGFKKLDKSWVQLFKTTH